MYRENWETVFPIKKQTMVESRNESGISGPALRAMMGKVNTMLVGRRDVRDTLEHQFWKTERIAVEAEGRRRNEWSRRSLKAPLNKQYKDESRACALSRLPTS